MTQDFTVTSAGTNPAEERSHRMRFYFISMGLRMACVASLFWLRGWWMLVAVVGAVLLPYFAVMIGNAIAPTHDTEAPSSVTPLELRSPQKTPESTGPRLLVVDAPAERSAQGERIHDTEPGSFQ